TLDQIRYHYPDAGVPRGMTPAKFLEQEVQAGVQWRYPEGISPKVQDQIKLELAIIAELGYETYFLTVYDIVRFARSQDILCQGRGAAANAAVCYCLGITEVDPDSSNALFARFISKERNEPPDIDVDFEHHRREEVIQYIYQKYGRNRAALTAVVISYRTKSALRDAGRALNIDPGIIDAISKTSRHWSGREGLAARPATRAAPRLGPARSRPAPAGQPGRGPRDLRHDLPGRHYRHIPDRVTRADEHAAAPETAHLLRPGDRSRPRAPRADPGR